MNTSPTLGNSIPGIVPSSLPPRSMARFLAAMKGASEEQKQEDRLVARLRTLRPAPLPPQIADRLGTAMHHAAEKPGTLAELVSNPWFVPVSLAAACMLFFAFNMSVVPTIDPEPAAGTATTARQTATDHRNDIGLAVDDIPPPLRHYCSLSDNEGIYVREVSPDGPAALAGIRPIDIILAIDGTPVANPAAITPLINAKKSGETIRIALLRAGQKTDVDVVLQQATDTDDASFVPHLDQNALLAQTSDVAQGLGNRAIASIAPSLQVREAINHSGSTILAELGQEAARVDPQRIIRNLENIRELSGKNGDRPMNGIASIRFEDKEGAIVVSNVDNTLYIEAIDHNGGTTFKGALNTIEARQTLPSQLFGRLKDLAANNENKQPAITP